MHALRRKHQQLIRKVVKVLVFIKHDLPMLEPTLQTPDDPIRFLPIPVRQIDNVAVDVVATHQIAQVRQHRILERALLNPNTRRSIVADRSQ